MGISENHPHTFSMTSLSHLLNASTARTETVDPYLRMPASRVRTAQRQTVHPERIFQHVMDKSGLYNSVEILQIQAVPFTVNLVFHKHQTRIVSTSNLPCDAVFSSCPCHFSSKLYLNTDRLSSICKATRPLETAERAG